MDGEPAIIIQKAVRPETIANRACGSMTFPFLMLFQAGVHERSVLPAD